MKVTGITQFRDNIKQMTDNYDIILIENKGKARGIYMRASKDLTLDQVDQLSKILNISIND